MPGKIGQMKGHVWNLWSALYGAASVVDSAIPGFAAGMPSEISEFEIVTVTSGARSLRSRQHGETFHPVVGPMTEARALHVEQQRLVERASAANEAFVIWDVGLGAAANAVAVLEAFCDFEGVARIELHSFDETTAPLAFALTHAESLGYVAAHRHAIERLLDSGETNDARVTWRLHRGDFRQRMADAPAPHAILYDPYSPRANPGLWTLEHFQALHARLDPARGCLWSNYTRSTAVRVTLLLAGFFVGRGAATGEKEETTIASTDPGSLTTPLDHAWLARVHRSTASAPLRASDGTSPIRPEDFARLTAHPQFACG
jgi:tRNA U34 5-methylaminomethyl-2-thiouridine-forming methyltransferase MnmC